MNVAYHGLKPQARNLVLITQVWPKNCCTDHRQPFRAVTVTSPGTALVLSNGGKK